MLPEEARQDRVSASDRLLVVVDPVARRSDGESVRIAKDVLSARAVTKLCLPEDPAEFARALARRGARRVVVVGDDRALLRAVTLLHREHALASCALSLVPVGTAVSLAHSLGVPAGAVAAARAVLQGKVRRLDLLVDDSGGVVLGGLRIPPGSGDGNGYGSGYGSTDGAGPGAGNGPEDGSEDGLGSGRRTRRPSGGLRASRDRVGRTRAPDGTGGMGGKRAAGGAVSGADGRAGDGASGAGGFDGFDGFDRFTFPGGGSWAEGPEGGGPRAGTDRAGAAETTGRAGQAAGTGRSGEARGAASGAAGEEVDGPRWLRHCQSLVRTLAGRSGSAGVPLPAGPLRRWGNTAAPPVPAPARLRVEADGVTLVDLDQPVDAIRVAPHADGLARIEIRPAGPEPGAEPRWVRAHAHTVTVSGADFRYRADALLAGPVRMRTWTVRAGAWGLTLPG
jgi:hypothetical protein